MGGVVARVGKVFPTLSHHLSASPVPAREFFPALGSRGPAPGYGLAPNLTESRALRLGAGFGTTRADASVRRTGRYRGMGLDGVGVGGAVGCLAAGRR